MRPPKSGSPAATLATALRRISSLTGTDCQPEARSSPRVATDGDGVRGATDMGRPYRHPMRGDPPGPTSPDDSAGGRRTNGPTSPDGTARGEPTGRRARTTRARGEPTGRRARTAPARGEPTGRRARTARARGE